MCGDNPRRAPLGCLAVDPKVPADWAKLTFMMLIILFVLTQVAGRFSFASRIRQSTVGG